MQSSARRVVIAALATLSLAASGMSFRASAEPTKVTNSARANTSQCSAGRMTETKARHVLRVAEHRLTLTNAGLRPGAFPSITDPARDWQTGPANQWTSGFFPGSLWLAYRHTHQPAFKADARVWTKRLAGQATDTSTHDIGFEIMSSFGNGYAITHAKSYKSIILRAAKSLATRYNPKVGAVRSWGARSNHHHFKVIIDNMMNLRLLFWASAHGGLRAWKHIATQHALTTAAHFVRHDGSVIHLVDFNPTTGHVKSTSNPQGYSADSTWSRGQAWAIDGFTAAYKETGDRRLLTAARRAAHYFTTRIPRDCVPYWDFKAPDIPDAATDTSAAAIAADGLLQLSRLDPSPERDAQYAQYASHILSSLTGHFIAKHGEATLMGSTATLSADPPNIGTSYGDYYLIEAAETWLQHHEPTSSHAAVRSPCPHMPKSGHR